jgi:flagellar basal body-associated protein FliL
MADAKKTEEAPKTEPKSSSMMKTIIIGAVMVLVPAIIAIALVVFVVLPRAVKSGENKEAKAKTGETTEAEEGEGEGLEGVVTIEFPEAQVNVQSANPNEPAPLLTYAVFMAVSGLEAGGGEGGEKGGGGKKILEDHKSWFTAMLGTLHRGRTLAELNDPQMQESILKQAKSEANALLKKIQPKGKLKVVEMKYTKFVIFQL